MKTDVYYEAVKKMASVDSDRLFKNHDMTCGTIVMSQMVSNLINKGGGSFLIFEGNWGDNVPKDKKYIEELYKHLNVFLKSQDNKLVVIIDQRKQEDENNKDLLRNIAEQKGNEYWLPSNVNVLYSSIDFENELKSKFKEPCYFSLGIANDGIKSFRIEKEQQLDIENGEAVCCFNDSKVVDLLFSSYTKVIDTMTKFDISCLKPRDIN